MSSRAGISPAFAKSTCPAVQAPKTGDVFRNPNLAKTYRLIAEGGRDAFYKGEIAEIIDVYMAEQGGFLTYEDLAAHKSEWVTPVSTNYRGYDVYELPPNGQGIVALQMLNILEGYDLRGMGFGRADYLHTLDRSEEAGLRRSREILRGSGLLQCSRQYAAFEGIRGTSDVR